MTDKPLPPLILSLVHTPALHDALRQHDNQFRFHWSLASGGSVNGLAEVAQIAELHPALIVIELDSPADWLPRAHSDPATRRIPIIAIADDDAARQRANAVEAETIVDSKRFLAELPTILLKNARIYSGFTELNNQCREAPPALVLKGLHQFNAQEYFECHETLEEAWNHESGPVRELYRAILQVSIAYYQIQRHNFSGAQKMFLRMLQWFEPLPDSCQGIDVAQLRRDAFAARGRLEALGPEQIAAFDLSLLKPVHFETIPDPPDQDDRDEKEDSVTDAIVPRFGGKIALVTGSGRGIGKAIALRLATEGADIVVNFFRNRAPAEEVAEAIRAMGRRALLIKADVGEEKDLDRLFQEIQTTVGGLDILVNNAASGYNRPVMDQRVKGWDWTMNINARSVLFATQRAVPLMQARGGGAVVNLSSIGANRVLPEYVVVGASKAALEAITRYLAVELAPMNIVVNAVSAGVVNTEALQHFGVMKDWTEDQSDFARKQTPAGRLVSVEDVAAAVAFLCSQDAVMIRGQVLLVDGGFTLGF